MGTDVYKAVWMGADRPICKEGSKNKAKRNTNERVLGYFVMHAHIKKNSMSAGDGHGGLEATTARNSGGKRGTWSGMNVYTQVHRIQTNNGAKNNENEQRKFPQAR